MTAECFSTIMRNDNLILEFISLERSQTNLGTYPRQEFNGSVFPHEKIIFAVEMTNVLIVSTVAIIVLA